MPCFALAEKLLWGEGDDWHGFFCGLAIYCYIQYCLDPMRDKPQHLVFMKYIRNMFNGGTILKKYIRLIISLAMVGITLVSAAIPALAYNGVSTGNNNVVAIFLL